MVTTQGKVHFFLSLQINSDQHTMIDPNDYFDLPRQQARQSKTPSATKRNCGNQCVGNIYLFPSGAKICACAQKGLGQSTCIHKRTGIFR